MKRPANRDFVQSGPDTPETLPQDFPRTVDELSPHTLQAQLPLQPQGLKAGIYFFEG
jgi:hypothetical protein